MRGLVPTGLLWALVTLQVLNPHCEAHADDAKTGPTKTASFEATFSERRPNSDLKALANRLKLLNAGEKVDSLQDYDLGQQGWWVYVPEKYDPAKPMGLIVLALYKAADSLPAQILPQL